MTKWTAVSCLTKIEMSAQNPQEAWSTDYPNNSNEDQQALGAVDGDTATHCSLKEK